MLLNCKNCKELLGGKAINIPENIAHCPNCDQVFRISDIITTDEAYSNDHKTNILMPDGIEVVPGLQLDIKLNWRKLSRITPYFIFGTIFTLMPFSIMYLLITGNEDGMIFPILILSIFLLIGLIMLIMAALRAVNTTYITAATFELQVQHRPFSILGWKNSNIPREDVVQLFVERHEESSSEDKVYYSYHLLAMLKNGNREVLISGLKKPEVAFYLEHQIEKRLGLEDRPIDSEYVPGKPSMHPLLQVAKHLDQMPKFLRKVVERQIEKVQDKR